MPARGNAPLAEAILQSWDAGALSTNQVQRETGASRPYIKHVLDTHRDGWQLQATHRRMHKGSQ